MEKILESIGIIDGHDIIAIGKIKAKKDKLFSEILKVDKKIQEDVKEITEEEAGRIFAITKKGKIKGLYLFEAKEENDSKILNHLKTVYTKDVKEEVQDKYDQHILNIAKDYVSMQEYKKVTFEDKIVQIDPKLTKKDKEIALLGGFAVGFMFGWIIFENPLLGIVYGIIFAPIFSGLKVVITKKRKKKNTKEKNN